MTRVRNFLLSLSVVGGLMMASANASDLLKTTMKTLDGKDISLEQYSGKVLFVVNVASKCGYTPQYQQLQAIHTKYADKGLAVVGVPCNQFGGQEPGSAAEISTFCEKNYAVTFDMMAKVDVNGAQQADLFKHLTSADGNGVKAGPIKWNFEKFLIGRNGEVVARFGSGVKPDSVEVVKAIETELAKK